MLLKREESFNLISSIRLNKHCPTLTHLFFTDDSLIFFKANNNEAERIKEVLKTYEKASGQMVNFGKSVCMISKNVEEAQARGICSSLGIKRSDSIGQYLGLPAQTGRNKAHFFNHLRDRVWKTLQGWKVKLFFMRGKKSLSSPLCRLSPFTR